MQPSVRSTKFNEETRLAPRGDEIRHVGRGTDCAGPDVYTEDGQLGLPITPEMLLSA
jgi:hypothetical protein